MGRLKKNAEVKTTTVKNEEKKVSSTIENNEKKYVFNVEDTVNKIIEWITNWFDINGKDCNAICGMSGGKDSTIAAALLAKALGPNRVIGVSMPDNNQTVNEADEICNYLGIKYIMVPIGKIIDAFNNTWQYSGKYENMGSDVNLLWNNMSAQNIPPRIRMTMLYSIAQSNNGRVSENGNLSENYIGYCTKYGDNAGDFSILGNLTVTEVKQIGHYLGIPDKWVEKKPDDGLPFSSPDEEKLGFTYDTLDKYIREGIKPTDEIKKKIDNMHKNNMHKFKTITTFKN